MNEQQLADLFSEQIDRMVGGETFAPAPVEDLSDLFNLGQELSRVRFQARPAAQAAFQSQLADWFVPTGGGLPTPTVLGIPKSLFLTASIVAVAMGATLGLFALLSSILAGTVLNQRDHSPPIQEATALPVITTSEPIEPEPYEAPASATPTATDPAASTAPVEVAPPATSALGDTVPAKPSSLRDTIFIPTATPEPIPTDGDHDDEIVGGDAGAPSGPGSEGETTPGQDDHDRGHGNDPDGYDDDNPGNSGGVGRGDDQENPGGNNQGQDGGRDDGNNKGGKGGDPKGD
ncbi:MAG: hypothetical protein JSV03_02155 [Planctomycetota bacterium]|nr:MAG: hypothetical protein JSV03_02155 [Planctomycetota bacterium]